MAACGAVQTPALLWRSGFRSPSGMLGRNLTLHPNAKVVAFFDEDVYGWKGCTRPTRCGSSWTAVP